MERRNEEMREAVEQDPDAHSCRTEASDYGICSVCGAIVSGTLADYELHGYDPPEPPRLLYWKYDG